MTDSDLESIEKTLHGQGGSKISKKLCSITKEFDLIIKEFSCCLLWNSQKLMLLSDSLNFTHPWSRSVQTDCILTSIFASDIAFSSTTREKSIMNVENQLISVSSERFLSLVFKKYFYQRQLYYHLTVHAFIIGKCHINNLVFHKFMN